MWLDPNETDPKAIEWLNNNVLMGFTEDREKWAGQPYATMNVDGNMTPWFATPQYSNGYPGGVPIEAVEKLFEVHVLEGPIFSYIPCDDLDEVMESGGYVDNENTGFKKVLDPSRKAIIHPVTGQFFNVRKSGYGVHQFDEWLINNVAVLLDADLEIGSAMLLKEGGVAAVSVELPDTIETKAGFPIRPRLLAYTSHDSTYQTTYMRSLESPLCDNSLSVEIRRDGNDTQKWTAKHTTASTLRVAEARDALTILYQQAEDMTAFVEELAEWEVTNQEFKTLMNQLDPVPEVKLGTGDKQGQIINQRAITLASNRRSEITTLYLKDDRVSPWKGTALGVLQAWNTWDQHERGVNSAGEVKGKMDGGTIERQMVSTLGGDVAKFDATVLNTLAEICERDKVAV